jgi:AcrR family transcriptional regulator
MTPTQQKPAARLTRQETRRRIIDAAAELVRERSYAELNVGELMERAGIGRTLFYRYFDDLGDLIMRASREAVEELYEAQLALAAARTDAGPDSIRAAIAVPVSVYRKHGPLLRAVSEAAAIDERVAAGQARWRKRFYALITDFLRGLVEFDGKPPADTAETVRALDAMNEGYLLDAFGREPRVSEESAVQTLTEIWNAVIRPPRS